jgi:hypothetical protein
LRGDCTHDPEVEHANPPIESDHHVLGLEISMYELCRMRSSEPFDAHVTEIQS